MARLSSANFLVTSLAPRNLPLRVHAKLPLTLEPPSNADLEVAPPTHAPETESPATMKRGSCHRHCISDEIRFSSLEAAARTGLLAVNVRYRAAFLRSFLDHLLCPAVHC